MKQYFSISAVLQYYQMQNLVSQTVAFLKSGTLLQNREVSDLYSLCAFYANKIVSGSCRLFLKTDSNGCPTVGTYKSSRTILFGNHCKCFAPYTRSFQEVRYLYLSDHCNYPIYNGTTFIFSMYTRYSVTLVLVKYFAT